MALGPIDAIQHYAFWRDGCRTLAMIACEVLRLAKEPVTKENIIQFVLNMPRSQSDCVTESFLKSYCCTCLEKVHASNAPKEDFDILFDYLVRYFPSRSWMSQEMLIDSFVGILQGIDLAGEPCPATVKG